MDADIALSKQFPYTEMVQFRWIEKTTKSIEKVWNLRRYFEVARLGIIDNLMMPGIAYRRLAVTEKSDYALAVWAQQAKLQARDKEVSLLNLQKLSNDLSYIRSLTMETPDVFCPQLEQELSECGIALILLPHMKGSFLHGASFNDGKKVVMGLTVRGRDADRFWFSLFHELDHVLEQHIDKPHGPTQEDEEHLEHATFSNIEHQSIDFAVHTIRPWLVRIEQAMNRALFTDQEKGRFYVQFNIDGLMRGDYKSRMEGSPIRSLLKRCSGVTHTAPLR